MNDLRTHAKTFLPYLALALIVGTWVVQAVDPPPTAHAQAEAVHSITGLLLDEQGEPIEEVEIYLTINDSEEPVEETASQSNGTYLIPVPEEILTSGHLTYERPHFETIEYDLSEQEVEQLNEDVSLRIDQTLPRAISAGFWAATVIFIGMLSLIATERLQKTIAALLGASLVLLISSVGGLISENLFIFEFEAALEYIDFDVIFLLMGMMIVIGIIEETGIFQWVAFRAYKLSGGKTWLLAVILMLTTAVASALLDNVTTMLLMTPITIEIALAMDINPLSLLLPEVMASNVGGIATLIGTPTNILIGSYAGLGFDDFLLNLTPGVIMAMAGLVLYSLWRYRKEHQEAKEPSQSMLERLEKNAQIEEPVQLRKGGIVFGVMLVAFVFGEAIHLEPAVTALAGAVAMLMWVNPDIENILTIVDWTTLLFFIGLFIVIGAVQEVGLIFLIADTLAELVGDNLALTQFTIVWSAALMSGVVDNIPFAAAMLPVVDFLTQTTGVQGNALFYGLSVGAAMGGNTSLIGSSANLVTAGIAERAGYRISFKKFLFVGFPAMLITVSIGTLWLFIRFFWM